MEFTFDDMMAVCAKHFSLVAIELAELMGKKLDFSEESVNTLEKILDWYHKDIQKGSNEYFYKGQTEEELVRISKIWGSYLGEVMIKNLSGEWKMSETNGIKDLYIRFNNGWMINPLNKIAKRIINGNEDDISGFYYAIKMEYSKIKK